MFTQLRLWSIRVFKAPVTNFPEYSNRFGEMGTVPSMNSVTPNGESTFFELPGEVRDLIYKEIRSTRDYAIFRVSKIARREGPPSQARTSIGYQGDEQSYSLPPYITATQAIQYARISVCTSRNLHLVSNFGLIEYFSGLQFVRESCQVTRDLTNHSLSATSESNNTLFRVLGTLVGFKKVGVTLCEMYIGSWNEFYPPPSEAQRVREELEGVLGLAMYYDDSFRCMLDFHPLGTSRAPRVE